MLENNPSKGVQEYMLYRLTNRSSFQTLVIMLILLSLVACDLVYDQGKDKKVSFYKYATEYIKADETIIQNTLEDKETSLEDLKLRDQVKTDLVNSPAPTVKQLQKLLASPHPLDKKVALVNIMFRKIYSQNLFEEIIELNNLRDYYFVKFYSYQCFNLLDQATMKQHEKEFIEILKWETSGPHIVCAMPSIIKLEPSIIIPLFARFFKYGDKGLKSASYVYLISLGNDYLAKVEKILEKENANEALEFLKAAKSGRRP